MSVFDDETLKQVKEELKQLKDEVKILFFEKDNCQYCSQIKEILTDLNGIDSRIKFETLGLDSDLAKENNVKEAPLMIFKGHNKGSIKFYGIPSGYEFSSLLHAILMTSRGDSKISKETKKYIDDLKEPLKLDVFVTPTCPYCPNSVILAFNFAMYSDKVEASMVEAMEYPDWANKHSVSGVPHTVINDGKSSYVGGFPEESALEKIKEAF